MQNHPEIWSLVDRHTPDLVALADRVWETPETCYKEVKSAASHRKELERQGFRVTGNVAGIPTALMGEAGSGGPVVAILGEYDALPGLSQQAGATEHIPLVAGGNGHGCGHNLLGAGAMLAAVALRDWLRDTGTPGRVRYCGCPAEEGGAAKAFMVRDGAFDDVDIAISWHPDCFADVMAASSLANARVDFRFKGRAAHAASSPHLGRSALDAVELMNVGVNYLREHVPTDARIHYAMIDSGGIAPNVVQANAMVRYSVRMPELADMVQLVERVRKVAEGAALMTETQMEMTVLSAVYGLLPNTPLEQAMREELEALGAPEFDDADRSYAAALRKSFGSEEIRHSLTQFGLDLALDVPLPDRLVPREARRLGLSGSTDVGDVSWAVPTVQMWGGTYAVGTPFHSWQMVAQGKSPHAHKGMAHAAKVMAAVGRRAFCDPALILRAKEDHARRTAGAPRSNPLIAGIAPPLGM
jgi:aminobenzoyl-glutamate utilization protein B